MSIISPLCASPPTFEEHVRRASLKVQCALRDSLCIILLALSKGGRGLLEGVSRTPPMRRRLMSSCCALDMKSLM